MNGSIAEDWKLVVPGFEALGAPGRRFQRCRLSTAAFHPRDVADQHGRYIMLSAVHRRDAAGGTKGHQEPAADVLADGKPRLITQSMPESIAFFMLRVWHAFLLAG